MNKLTSTIIGTCLTLGVFTIAAGPFAASDATAATHGPDAVQSGKLFDGLRMSRPGNGRSSRSVLTLPGDPRQAATKRIARHLSTKTAKSDPSRINWHINDARGAYRQAVAQGKPLVLVFGTSKCGFCQKLLTEVLPGNSVNRLAGRAVFAYSEPVSDSSAGYIATKLQVRQAPTITVIEPIIGKFKERARITGYFSATQLSDDLEKFLSVKTSWNGAEVIPASAKADLPAANVCTD